MRERPRPPEATMRAVEQLETKMALQGEPAGAAVKRGLCFHSSHHCGFHKRYIYTGLVSEEVSFCYAICREERSKGWLYSSHMLCFFSHIYCWADPPSLLAKFIKIQRENDIQHFG